MRFTKMHGIGNDYLFINCFEEYVSDPSRLAVEMCREHTGVGGDGIVLLEPAERLPFSMRIFNKDGSEAEMCGNAARCIGKYLYERGMTRETEIDLHTGSGIRHLSLHTASARCGLSPASAWAIPTAWCLCAIPRCWICPSSAPCLNIIRCFPGVPTWSLSA